MLGSNVSAEYHYLLLFGQYPHYIETQGDTLLLTTTLMRLLYADKCAVMGPPGVPQWPEGRVLLPCMPSLADSLARLLDATRVVEPDTRTAALVLLRSVMIAAVHVRPTPLASYSLTLTFRASHDSNAGRAPIYALAYLITFGSTYCFTWGT